MKYLDDTGLRALWAKIKALVPSHVRNITEEDIDKWNSGGGITGDTLPIGSVVDFEGETIPENWVEVEEDELHYKAGDSYITGSTYGAGMGAFLTTSRTQIVFDIIMPKRITNINGFNVNSLAVRVRHCSGGYLLTNNTSAYANVITNKDSQGNNLEVNCTSITTQKINDYQLRIGLIFDKAIHETNNIPLSVEYRNIDISFT